VRKLGVPGQEELAMGAIASGDVRVFNSNVIDALRLSPGTIEAVTAFERRELERREQAYRGNRPQPEIRGRTVILVDDGIATGSTMRAAVASLRQLEVTRIIVAAPTAALATVQEMAPEVDEIVTVMTPEDFRGVGEWYEDFSQLTDDDVREVLDRAVRPTPAH
jgi:predicted phosphoribosyltransferase